MHQPPYCRIALVLFSTFAMASHAAVYRCADENGRLIFQDQPCRLDSKASPPATPTNAPFRAHLLIVESNAEIERWVLTPSHKRGPDSARLRSVRRGQRLLVPAVVTDYTPDASGRIRLSADFQLIGPGGAVVLNAQGYSSSSSQDPRTPGLVVLEPVLNLTPEPPDPLGVYTVRLTVWDGARSARAEERFELKQ